jgi:hypothetical protein
MASLHALYRGNILFSVYWHQQASRAKVSSNKMQYRQDKNTQNRHANCGESRGNWCEIGDTCKIHAGYTSAGDAATCSHHQHELQQDHCVLTLSNSNFSATRILPSSYLFWAGKRLVDCL